MFSRKRKDTTDPSRPGEAPMAAVRRLSKTVSFNLADEMPPSRGLTRRIDDLLPPGFPCDAGEGEETVELKRNASFKRAISIMQWMEETKNQDDQKQQQQHQKTPSTTQSEASTILALGSSINSLNSSVSDVQVPPTPAPAPATQASPNAKAPSSSCLQSNLNRGWELLFLQCRAALNENRTLKSQCEVMRQICLGQAVKLERIRDVNEASSMAASCMLGATAKPTKKKKNKRKIQRVKFAEGTKGGSSEEAPAEGHQEEYPTRTFTQEVAYRMMEMGEDEDFPFFSSLLGTEDT